MRNGVVYFVRIAYLCQSWENYFNRWNELKIDRNKEKNYRSVVEDYMELNLQQDTFTTV